MTSDPIVEKVSRVAETILPSLGLELVEIQFRREQHGWVLRVFIDAEEGVSLDHCSQVSRELGDYLDVEDLIDHPYNLEVSSPGLERKLHKKDDFIRFTGKKAKIKLHQPVDGQKTFTGILREANQDAVIMELDGGKSVELTFDSINIARLAI